jgi:spore coat polysaccharide biosynthesis protein SpsF (cytidylyltransferase family)/aryl-alcohol dehydrogenase-like predicted oxidoreductase
MILAIIQARMGSSRLPGKVLLDLAGRPVLWHAVSRVQKARLVDQVLVATTDQPSDEPIRRFCAEQAVQCFGGSEQDVLDRFVQAARFAGATESDAIVRITADCPLIDPAVIDRVVAAYRQTGADYVSNVQPPTFPDGLDVEVFHFSALLTAWREAKLVSEREHVTPYLRNHPEKFSAHNVTHDTDLSALRWTLDEPADYALLQRIVAELDRTRPNFHLTDVLQILAAYPEWQELNRDFQRNEGYVKSLRQEQARLCLGTVQFGLAYGINNRGGRPEQERVFAILDRALAAGIESLDTAAAYGEAEKVLGEYIRSRQVADRVNVVSKLRPDFLDNTSKRTISLQQALKEEVQTSLARLGLTRLDGYLLHSASCEQLNHAELGAALAAVRESGLVRQVGASLYTPEQAMTALQTEWVDAVQVPYNILDRRLDQAEFFDRNSQRSRPLTVYVRSLLLQGLLMMPEQEIPPHLLSIAPHLRELDQWLAGQGIDRLTAAFGFVSSRPGVDAVVVGVDSLEQLELYLALSARIGDFSAILSEGLQRFGEIEPRLLSPNLWEALRQEKRDE